MVLLWTNFAPVNRNVPSRAQDQPWLAWVVHHQIWTWCRQRLAAAGGTSGVGSESSSSRPPGERFHFAEPNAKSACDTLGQALPRGDIAERDGFLNAQHLTSPSAEMPSASEISLLTGAEVSDCLPALNTAWNQAGFGACLQFQVLISAGIQAKRK